MPVEGNLFRQQQDQLAALGKALVGQLFVLFKTSYHYSEGHAALQAPLSHVLHLVREINRSREEATLRIHAGHLFLADLRLKSDAAGYEAARFVTEEMKRHLIGSISFGISVTTEDLRRFVYALRENDAGPTPENYTALLLRLKQRMVGNIEVETLEEEVERGVLESGKEQLEQQLSGDKEANGKFKARALYQRALLAVEEVLANAGGNQPLRLRESKRVVQRLIDLLASHEATLLGLAGLRQGAEPSPQHHAVNVCILSLVIGKRLGMSKFHLSELGMAALLHDIGKVELPRELLEKPGELSPGERELFEKHPLTGVKKVMTLKGLDVMTARIVTGIFEHHLLADFSGYPRLRYGKLSLLGRVIGIADRYDELTTSRLHGNTPVAPARALRLMMAEAGRRYDQGLLKLFMTCVGIHGIGSLLFLDSRELAVVLQNNPDPSLWDHPRVKIIANAEGREVDGESVDLAAAGNRRRILATLDPNSFDLDVSRYF